MFKNNNNIDNSCKKARIIEEKRTLNKYWLRYCYEVEEKYKKYKKQDEQNHYNIRIYNPDVKLEKFLAGYFLCYDKIAIPIKYIVNIEIKSLGEEPKIIKNYICSDNWMPEDYKKIFVNYLLFQEWLEKPTRYSNFDERPGAFHYPIAIKAAKASIVVHMQTGIKYYIECSRHEIPILYDRLLEIWKSK